MNKKTIFLALSAAALCGWADEPQYTISATASTRDGSVIRGEMLTEKFSGDTLFCKGLELAPESIATLSFVKTNGETRVHLANGDTFTYALKTTEVSIQSALGKLSIPCHSLRSISLSKRRVFNAGTDLVYSCDFESEAEVPNFKGGSIVEGKFGQALHVPPRTSAGKTELPVGAIGCEGAIEFWGKIDPGAYMEDGGCPRFFEIIDMTTKREISQDWNANNGDGGYGLTFRMDGLPPMVSSRYRKTSYESILGDPTSWHHYALVWNANGLDVKGPIPVLRPSLLHDKGVVGQGTKPNAAVFVDGRCVMATSSDFWKGPVLSDTGATLFFPSREDEMPEYSRIGYTIDQFRIWNVAKTEFGE